MTEKPRLLLDIVADPVCPWCYVGLKSFLKARNNLEKSFEIVTRLRPYQLNPDTPKEGVNRKAYYQKKFPDNAQLATMREALAKSAQEIGFSFDPSAPVRLPNTLKAHQLIRWAHFEGKQEAVGLEIYKSYWDELSDIGEDAVLANAAELCGMDGESVRLKLAHKEDAELVQNEAEAFRRAGVSGVPTFVVNERTGFSGAMQPAQLEAAIRQAAQMTEEAST